MVRDNIVLIVAAALIVTALKAGIIYVLFRPTCGQRADAIRAGSVLTAAGEFAFVLLPLGAGLGDAEREGGERVRRHRGHHHAARPAGRDSDRETPARAGRKPSARRTISPMRPAGC